MAWDRLSNWGAHIAPVERLSGGVINDVWKVRIDGNLRVARQGERSAADLDWEVALLRHLQSSGVSVPDIIPTQDGRDHVDGMVVMSVLEGDEPETPSDWRRVADTLRQVHAATRNWPQRPGWRSSCDLVAHDTGTRIDLRNMPPAAVAKCRAVWAQFASHATCVVHGDPNKHNIRMTGASVSLLDWDEAHVDVPALDLALPGNAAELDENAYDLARMASAAWEAAICWGGPYALRRLEELPQAPSRD